MVCWEANHYQGISDRWDNVWGPLLKPMGYMGLKKVEYGWKQRVTQTVEDIGQGQMSSHVTHLLMLMFICTKYGKNPSRTVDATERTRFSRSRPNDLENIGQGQRSLHVTHPLMLVMNCAKNGKNAFAKICQKFKFSDSDKNVTRDTPSNDSNHLCWI